MNLEIVLARLDESVDWIAQIKPEISVIIYNFKSAPISTPRQAKNILIPDAGQEAGAYAEHIVTNYENLADVTIFSQADPTPHCNQGRSFVQIAHCIAVAPIRHFEYVGDKCHSSADDPLARRVHLHHSGNPSTPYSKTPLRDACKFLLNQECPEKIEHPYGGIFSASRQAIQKHPLEFWRRLHRWCTHSKKTWEAAIMEKLWFVVLGENL